MWQMTIQFTSYDAHSMYPMQPVITLNVVKPHGLVGQTRLIRYVHVNTTRLLR